MTKAACQLIVQLSTLALSWRSIKELQKAAKSSTEAVPTTGSEADGGGRSLEVSNSSQAAKKAMEAPITIEMDMEILQLWALCALHKLYISSPLERYIPIFFPPYYYVKMIILIITLLPNTKFPNFWFETLLVPLMIKCHELLDLNWKGMIMREVTIMLPWRILDWTLCPGLLMSEEEERLVWDRRRRQLKKAFGGTLPEKVWSHSDDDNDKTHHGVLIGKDKTVRKVHHGSKKLIINRSVSDGAVGNAASKPNKYTRSTPSSRRRIIKNPAITRKKRGNTAKNETNELTSPVARSRVAASGMNLRKFSREHKKAGTSPSVSPTRRRRRRKPSLDSNSTPSRTQNRSSRFADSVMRRVTTRRRNIYNNSDDSSNTPSVIKQSRPGSKKGEGDGIQKKSNREGNNKVPEQKMEQLDNPSSIEFDGITDSKQSGRNSLSQQVRTFIIGDANIRLRDYLFDVNLPIIPSPRNKNKNPDDTHNDLSTTTRSSEVDDFKNDGGRQKNIVRNKTKSGKVNEVEIGNVKRSQPQRTRTSHTSVSSIKDDKKIIKEKTLRRSRRLASK